MTRFKITAIPAYTISEWGGEVTRKVNVALFYRRWWGWSRIAAFADTAAAKAHYDTIADLPQYLR